LSDHDIRYVLIGDVAAIVHGVPRTTFDVDLLIESSEMNVTRLLAALTTPHDVLAHEITVFRDTIRIDMIRSLLCGASCRRVRLASPVFVCGSLCLLLCILALVGCGERGQPTTPADITWRAYVDALSRAVAAIEAQSWADARAALEQCPEEHRGWEWRHLREHANSVIMHVPGVFTDIQVSPDGGTFLALPYAPAGGTVLLGTMTPEPSLREIATGAKAAALCATDSRVIIAVAFDEGHVRLFDANGDHVGLPMHVSDLVYSLHLSPDGSLLLAVCWNRTAELWRTDGTRIAGPIPHNEEVFSSDGPVAAFAPDGSYFVLRPDPYTLARFDTAGRRIGRPIYFGDEIRRVQWTDDREVLLVTQESGTIELVHVNGHRTAPPTHVATRIRGARLSPDQRSLLVTPWWYDVTLHDLHASAPPRPASEGHGSAAPASFLDNGKRIVLAGTDHRVYVSDRDGREHDRFAPMSAPITDLWRNTAGSRLAAVAADQTIESWHVDGAPAGNRVHLSAYPHFVLIADQTVEGIMRSHDYGIHGHAVVLPASRIGTARSHHPQSLDVLSLLLDDLDAHFEDTLNQSTIDTAAKLLDGARIERSARSPDGRRLVIATADRRLHVFEADPIRPVVSFKLDVGLSGLAFTTDGTRLVMSDRRGTLHVWDSRDHEERATEHARRAALVDEAAQWVTALDSEELSREELLITIIKDASSDALLRLVALDIAKGRQSAEEERESLIMNFLRRTETDPSRLPQRIMAMEGLSDRLRDAVLAHAATWIPDDDSLIRNLIDMPQFLDAGLIDESHILNRAHALTDRLPDNGMAWTARAIAEASAGRWSEAIMSADQHRRLVDAPPDEPFVYLSDPVRVVALAHLGRRAEAEQLLFFLVTARTPMHFDPDWTPPTSYAPGVLDDVRMPSYQSSSAPPDLHWLAKARLLLDDRHPEPAP